VPKKYPGINGDSGSHAMSFLSPKLSGGDKFVEDRMSSIENGYNDCGNMWPSHYGVMVNTGRKARNPMP
jgi:hypothetical protein